METLSLKELGEFLHLMERTQPCASCQRHWQPLASQWPCGACRTHLPPACARCLCTFSFCVSNCSSPPCLPRLSSDAPGSSHHFFLSSHGTCQNQLVYASYLLLNWLALLRTQELSLCLYVSYSVQDKALDLKWKWKLLSHVRLFVTLWAI